MLPFDASRKTKDFQLCHAFVVLVPQDFIYQSVLIIVTNLFMYRLFLFIVLLVLHRSKGVLCNSCIIYKFIYLYLNSSITMLLLKSQHALMYTVQYCKNIVIFSDD